ncbi:MAG TPA: Error-prone repair protein ImuA [Panacibacter sp.]|nr:Error-prone repair protein ImuA [Panacibacter sp.]HNP45492.1 Error-prone repair protein ImuA [Panacibacter sp.]
MDAVKRDIIARLERDILPFQGLKLLTTDNTINLGFRPMEQAFPHAQFPIGATHEFLSASPADIAATNGFVSVLLSKLMQLDGAAAWISASRTLFPAALKSYGIAPDKLIFIDMKKERDVFYAVEEALKCKRLSAVMGEIKQVSFKESRRLQLAAEQSRVTGFIIRHQPGLINTIACVSRWRISTLPSEPGEGLPGVGFPKWQVELLKVRNGRPGKWDLEWSHNRLQGTKQPVFSITQHERQQTG